MSCINQSVDHAPVEPSFADIKDRPKCTIPWLENDPVPTAPQPVGWLAGPGGVWPNREPWAEVSKRKAFVERFAALRPRVRGAANIEPFDYRLNTYRYMKAVAEAGCARGKLDIGMEDTAAEKDPSKRQATARGLAADRTHMSRLWEQAIILHRSSPPAVAVHWRRLAKGAHRRIELRNIGRATLEAKLPPASGSFEYHITAQSSTGKPVWPTTAPTTSQTVVVW